DGLKDRGLLRAAKHARESEVAREAVKRLSDKDLALQFPAILDSRREIPLALLNAKTLDEAAAKTDNPAWLLRLLAHARTDREIDSLLDRPEVVARIAVLASEACFPVEVLERIIARFPDQLQSESIPPERAARLNEKTMLAIARKGATDAWLKKTAAAWSGDKDAWLALARLVHDADWLVEQAADINRSWYAPEILGGLEAKDIAARTKHILERLPFRAVESIVEKLGPCPACGGKIEIERRGWTHTAGGPADSFYRESVSYEATTTSESIRCASCGRVFAEESHTG
ncbi:MAG TPA: hypothetical protein PK969_12220, partial [Treponemataceae bacterium]|nr:hypothetical protein [Treponemataceae bacterium]